MTQPAKKPNGEQDKAPENWLWDAACSICGVQDAAKYKHLILPLVVKRLCDVYNHINRIAEQVGNNARLGEKCFYRSLALCINRRLSRTI